jgi:NAD(P)-dependent dehydrogenase (short-subunit alcohol dehydrogenase family)
MDYFREKVAIVTGGAHGIGRELSKLLGRMGAIVVIADIDLNGAKKTASEVKAEGGSATAVKVDVTKEAAVKKLVEKTVVDHKRLDMIFNNAGITVVGDMRDVKIEHFRRIIDINLWGVIYGTMSAYPIMVKQGFGHIINISSVSGLVPFPTGTPYATTKYAVVGLSESLRVEAEEFGVNVSVVCLGNIKSDIFKTGTFIKVSAEDVKNNIPIKMMETEKAALKILSGVSKNKGTIVFPIDSIFLWALHRIKPAFINPILRKMVKGFREMRKGK